MPLKNLDERQLHEYLKRIHYSDRLQPTHDVLAALQLAHLRTVPFENLDIHLKHPIVLDVERLFAKIVQRTRGGFCYECNGLFAALLQTIGFKVTMLSAGVARQSGGYSPDFDHMTLRVDLEQPWLVEVGFGDSFIQPLRLQKEVEQFDGRKSYRFQENDGIWILEEREEEKPSMPQFRFSLQPRELADYVPMCKYHQTSPESSFTQKRVCSLLTESGRITLSDWKLITTRDNKREERALNSQSEYDQTLRELFSITL
jgi:N-hydroxyarylamine O-acetyltransferase